MAAAPNSRITLASLLEMRAAGQPFAMLTAYDFPTAAAAQAAGVHSLLIGDSMGTVLLGHANTRGVPLELMLILGEAVRRGAPNVWLAGDMPYQATLGGVTSVLRTAERFRDEAGCDAVKIEADSRAVEWVERVSAAGIDVIAHLGLRPQTVLTPDGYRAQARDEQGVTALVADARAMCAAGAAMLLLEAVPNEAAQAVVAAADVPVIGCGAGPACHGHVVVTHDMLGIGSMRPPRFVPVLAQAGLVMQEAMRQYVLDITSKKYPGSQHGYPMRQSVSAGIPEK